MIKISEEEIFEAFAKHLEENPEIIKGLAEMVNEIWNIDNPNFENVRTFLTKTTIDQIINQKTQEETIIEIGKFLLSPENKDFLQEQFKTLDKITKDIEISKKNEKTKS